MKLWTRWTEALERLLPRSFLSGVLLAASAGVALSNSAEARCAARLRFSSALVASLQRSWAGWPATRWPWPKQKVCCTVRRMIGVPKG